MTMRRRSLWLWGAAALVCVCGVLAGPAIFAVAESLWFAAQPRSFTSGWDIIAVVGLLGAAWLGAIYAVARRLRGAAGWLFALAAFLVAGAAVAAENPSPPTEVTTITLSDEQAGAWRKYRP